MFKKLKIKFVITAIIAISILLIGILATINIVNFSLVTKDSESLLNMIIEKNGDFGENFGGPQGRMEGMGPMGPSSPDTRASTRYFTFAFKADGTYREIVYNIEAISKEDSVAWAKELTSSNGGWTRLIYRYRTYTIGDETYVTIIDQGRELLPSYRVLIASIVGTIVGLVVSLIVLICLSKRFIKPLVDSDNKQKKFVGDAAREIRLPLSTINLDMEEVKMNGESDATRSIDKQLFKLNKLALKLNDLLLFGDMDLNIQDVDFSSIVEITCISQKEAYEKMGKILNKDIEENVHLSCDVDMISKLVFELIENGGRFAKSFVNVSLKKQNDRIVLIAENDADGLEDGDMDTVFETFYKGSLDTDGSGLGLSIIKKIVDKHKGRVKARAEGGKFILKVEL